MLQASGLEAPPGLAAKSHDNERNEACLPRIDDSVSVCMLALALLNKEDAENMRLDDVLAEHQRDGSHYKDNYAKAKKHTNESQWQRCTCLRSTSVATC